MPNSQLFAKPAAIPAQPPSVKREKPFKKAVLCQWEPLEAIPPGWREIPETPEWQPWPQGGERRYAQVGGVKMRLWRPTPK